MAGSKSDELILPTARALDTSESHLGGNVELEILKSVRMAVSRKELEAFGTLGTQTWGENGESAFAGAALVIKAPCLRFRYHFALYWVTQGYMCGCMS
jgi:hypothetical protein